MSVSLLRTGKQNDCKVMHLHVHISIQNKESAWEGEGEGGMVNHNKFVNSNHQTPSKSRNVLFSGENSYSYY